MTAMDLFETNGTSPPAVEAFLYRLTVEHWTSLRVDDPEKFEHLPPRFVLRRKAGAWWVVDSAAPAVVQR